MLSSPSTLSPFVQKGLEGEVATVNSMAYNQHDEPNPTAMENQELTSELTSPAATDIFILVLGRSGAGKTSFVNLVSGSDLPVEKGFESCTKAIGYSKPIEIEGNRRLWLIDTPGFDGSARSDDEVLKELANYLATLYRSGTVLSGVIYFHRISDVRMGAISKRNLEVFQKICGRDFFPNVVLLTTMWKTPATSAETNREEELRTKDAFFKPLIDAGGSMLRYDRTLESAWIALTKLSVLEPQPLLLQREMVCQNLPWEVTTAGRQIQKSPETTKSQEQPKETLVENRGMNDTHLAPDNATIDPLGVAQGANESMPASHAFPTITARQQEEEREESRPGTGSNTPNSSTLSSLPLLSIMPVTSDVASCNGYKQSPEGRELLTAVDWSKEGDDAVAHQQNEVIESNEGNQQSYGFCPGDSNPTSTFNISHASLSRHYQQCIPLLFQDPPPSEEPLCDPLGAVGKLSRKGGEKRGELVLFANDNDYDGECPGLGAHSLLVHRDTSSGWNAASQALSQHLAASL